MVRGTYEMLTYRFLFRLRRLRFIPFSGSPVLRRLRGRRIFEIQEDTVRELVADMSIDFLGVCEATLDRIFCLQVCLVQALHALSDLG